MNFGMSTISCPIPKACFWTVLTLNPSPTEAQLNGRVTSMVTTPSTTSWTRRRICGSFAWRSVRWCAGSLLPSFKPYRKPSCRSTPRSKCDDSFGTHRCIRCQNEITILADAVVLVECILWSLIPYVYVLYMHGSAPKKCKLLCCRTCFRAIELSEMGMEREREPAYYLYLCIILCWVHELVPNARWWGVSKSKHVWIWTA